MKSKLLITGALSLSLAAFAPASVVFNLGVTINGSTPTGTQPFLTATFETISTGTVRLTMTNNMPSSNYVSTWLFNTTSNSSLSIGNVAGKTAAVSHSNNSLNGGAQIKGGLFDISFTFPTPNNGGRLSGGTTSVYSITGTGITETSFLSKSIADGNNPGGYYSAADIRGFGNGLSGSIGTTTTAAVTPEPASIAALGLGLLGVIRRKRKS